MTSILDHVMMAFIDLMMPVSMMVAGNPVLDWGFYIVGVSACTYLLWVASYNGRVNREVKRNDGPVVLCIHCHSVIRSMGVD